MNSRLPSLLSKEFPEHTVDDIDVLSLIRRRPLTLATCLVGGVAENFWSVVTRRISVKKAMVTSGSFADAARRIVAAQVSPATHLFTMQSQSLFPADVPGVPHFVFTDHAHLANLAYPFFDVRHMAGRRFLARERAIYRSATRVFVRSENVANVLVSSYGVSAQQVVTVGVGPNVPTPTPSATPRQWHDGRIVFVGVDWERKGGQTLVEAFERVRRRHPRARLEIVGCNPDVRNAPGITVHGRLELDEVATLLAECDVFCLPTRVEPFGVAFIEAMHAGLAVVGTRIGAIPDFVRDDETGALVDPHDASGLADVLSTMLDRPERTQEMGAAGRLLAAERYQWNTVMARIGREVNHALESPPTTSSGPGLPDSALRIAAMVVGLRIDGGAETLLRTLLHEVQDSVCDVTVVTLRTIDPGTRLDIERLGAKMVEVPGRRLVSPLRFLRLLRQLRRGRFDVIHTNLVGANVLGLAAGALLRIPVVVTLHSTRSSGDDHWYHGKLERYFIRHHAARVIAVGDETAVVRGEVLGSGVDIHVLPNAVTPAVDMTVDARQALRREVMVDEKAPLFINVGRLTPAKGHDDLLRAFANVFEELGRGELALVGSGGRREELTVLADELGIADQVHFMGSCANARELTAAADVFVLSSVWEGLPMAILEAMEAGTAIVATDVGDVRDVLSDTPARVVPPSDHVALATAMLATLDDVTTGRDLTSAARRVVADRFSSARWAERVVDHYRAVLA
ncbi:MAG TPA: glycosyltransferase [Ilumatobacter sp.]|nr:glycosyltransferase [Ilumatobacter sp.]